MTLSVDLLLKKAKPGNFSIVPEEDVGLVGDLPVGLGVLLPHVEPLPVKFRIPEMDFKLHLMHCIHDC